MAAVRFKISRHQSCSVTNPHWQEGVDLAKQSYNGEDYSYLQCTSVEGAGRKTGVGVANRSEYNWQWSFTILKNMWRELNSQVTTGSTCYCAFVCCTVVSLSSFIWWAKAWVEMYPTQSGSTIERDTHMKAADYKNPSSNGWFHCYRNTLLCDKCRVVYTGWHFIFSFLTQDLNASSSSSTIILMAG